MADTNQQQQLKEITERLEQGIKSLFDSETYKSYLKTMSKFHNYSFSNTLLIAMQKPDATLVAGYGAWQSKFKRNVMRGEKSIKIFAPAPYKAEMEKLVIDPDTKRPVLDEFGEQVKETITVKKPAFKVTSVFDVSQTDGEPLPEIAVDELTGSVEGYDLFFRALEKTSKVPIEFEAIHDGANGYYHHIDKRIALREGMSEIQSIKTAIHELAHSRLHDVDVKESLGGKVVDRHTREVQAESVAYTVCQHYGIETSDYSFGYIAGWSNGRELPELKSSMETIRSEANSMIQKIDQNLEELRLVHEVDKGVGVEDAFYHMPVLEEYLNGMEQKDIEREIREYVLDKINDMDEPIEILGVQIYGSRSHGIHNKSSDLDVVVEYTGNMKEDALFNLLHDVDYRIGDMQVDVNPIREEESGKLVDFMERANAYMEQKVSEKQQIEDLENDMNANEVGVSEKVIESALNTDNLQQEDYLIPIMDNTILLASDLSDFAQEADPYEYLDMYDSASDLFNETLKSIEEGNTSDIREWLTSFIEEDDPLAKKAAVLLERVKGADSAREQFEDELEADIPEMDCSETDCPEADVPKPDDLRKDTSHITFYAAECMEFPNFGELHEGLTMDKALEIYDLIPKERMNGGKGIGFELHDGSVYDGPFDLMVNGKMQTDIINEINHYRNSPLVQNAIRELEAKLNDNSLEQIQPKEQFKAVEQSQIKEHLQPNAEPEEGAFQIGDQYLYVQKATDGSWDYTLYNHQFEEMDGGQLGDETMDFEQAVDEIIQFNDLTDIEVHSIPLDTFDNMLHSEVSQKDPIYPHGFNEADSSDDMDAWRQSHNATCNCAQDFIKGFEMAYHNRCMNEFLKDMVDKYGMDRCFIVLASTIQLSQEDGRYYPSTKKSAMEVQIPGKSEDNLKDSRTQYRVGCHPVTINAAFRELTKMKLEQQKNELTGDLATMKDERKSRTSVLDRLYDKQKQVTGLNVSDYQNKGKNRGEVL